MMGDLDQELRDAALYGPEGLDLILRARAIENSTEVIETFAQTLTNKGLALSAWAKMALFGPALETGE